MPRGGQTEAAATKGGRRSESKGAAGGAVAGRGRGERRDRRRSDKRENLRTTRVGRPRGGMKVAARIGEGLRRGRRPRVGDGRRITPLSLTPIRVCRPTPPSTSCSGGSRASRQFSCAIRRAPSCCARATPPASPGCRLARHRLEPQIRSALTRRAPHAPLSQRLSATYSQTADHTSKLGLGKSRRALTGPLCQTHFRRSSPSNLSFQPLPCRAGT